MLVLASLYVLFWPEPAGAGGAPPGADKVVHLVLFGLLAATARLPFGGDGRVLVAVLVYGVVSEVLQALLLSGRSGDLLDVAADVAGALAGWWLSGRGRARTSPRTLDASGLSAGRAR